MSFLDLADTFIQSTLHLLQVHAFKSHNYDKKSQIFDAQLKIRLNVKVMTY